MSAADYLLTEEQLLCCICLDVFSDPVTVPCGHNFCKKCITQHLNSNSQRLCPMCNERVDRKCKFGVNTFISEMSLKYRQSAGRKEGKRLEQQVAEPGEVSCDVPTGTNLLPSYCTALKICLFLVFGLFCLAIGFTVNLNFHKACPKHGKPLELYCKKEQMPICQSCADSSHRFHDIVPLKEEYEAKIKELQETKAVIHQKIQERHLKIQEIKHSVLASSEAAGLELADGVQVFTALTKTLEENHAEVIRMMEAKHQTTVKQAGGFTKELQQEISELFQRWNEVEWLSRSKDHLHFLQSFPFLNTAPLAGDLPDVSLSPASYEGLLRTAMEAAVVQLTETATHEMKKLKEAELLRLLQYAVDVTLDPDTAHPVLIVSDDGKQVHHSDVWNEVSDNPKRFDHFGFVLGKQSFSLGRFCYDVQVKGKTSWILGVAKESVNRKGNVQVNSENGVWALLHRHSHQYFPLTGQPYLLDVKDQPEKVRVFVDYEEGLVSFYNVDSAALIYSFTGCSFTERIYPIFCPDDSVPLILTPAPSLN